VSRPKPPLRFDVLTLFPRMFEGPFSESILKREWYVFQALNQLALHDPHDVQHALADARGVELGGHPGAVVPLGAEQLAPGQAAVGVELQRDAGVDPRFGALAAAHDVDGAALVHVDHGVLALPLAVLVVGVDAVVLGAAVGRHPEEAALGVELGDEDVPVGLVLEALGLAGDDGVARAVDRQP